MIGLALVGGVILGLRLRIGLALSVTAAFVALHLGFQLADGLTVAFVEAWFIAALTQAVALSVAIVKDVFLTPHHA